MIDIAIAVAFSGLGLVCILGSCLRLCQGKEDGEHERLLDSDTTSDDDSYEHVKRYHESV